MDFVVECIPRPWPKKIISGKHLVPCDPDKLFGGYKENVQTTVKLQMNQCGYKMIEKDKPVILGCHFFLPRPKQGHGSKMLFPILAGGKNKSPDLDNLEYAIGNILEKICYWNDVQIVGRPFGPTKNYADKMILRWPIFYSNIIESYCYITPALGTHISNYLRQCKQPFTGVFIRVEKV